MSWKRRRREQQAEAFVSAEILRHKYDANNRLTNRWSAAKGDTYYSYDPVGNLTNINYPTSTDVKFATLDLLKPSI